ncbi:MAG: hypothetical protein ACO1RT_01170, partial [Planctomycetaceae bacterium]
MTRRGGGPIAGAFGGVWAAGTVAAGACADTNRKPLGESLGVLALGAHGAAGGGGGAAKPGNDMAG